MSEKNTRPRWLVMRQDGEPVTVNTAFITTISPHRFYDDDDDFKVYYQLGEADSDCGSGYADADALIEAGIPPPRV